MRGVFSVLRAVGSALNPLGCPCGDWPISDCPCTRDSGSDPQGEKPEALSGEAIAERRCEDSASPRSDTKPHSDTPNPVLTGVVG